MACVLNGSPARPSLGKWNALPRCLDWFVIALAGNVIGPLVRESTARVTSFQNTTDLDVVQDACEAFMVDVSWKQLVSKGRADTLSCFENPDWAVKVVNEHGDLTTTRYSGKAGQPFPFGHADDSCSARTEQPCFRAYRPALFSGLETRSVYGFGDRPCFRACRQVLISGLQTMSAFGLPANTCIRSYRPGDRLGLGAIRPGDQLAFLGLTDQVTNLLFRAYRPGRFSGVQTRPAFGWLTYFRVYRSGQARFFGLTGQACRRNP